MPLTYRVQIDPQPSRAALNESHKKTWITGPNQPLKWMNDYGVICAKAQTQLKQSSKSQRHNDSIVSPHSLFQHLSVLFANHVLHIFAFVYVSIFFFANMEKRMRMWGYMRPLASFTSWTYMSKLSGAKAFLIRTMPTVFRHAPDPPQNWETQSDYCVYALLPQEWELVQDSRPFSSKTSDAKAMPRGANIWNRAYRRKN